LRNVINGKPRKVAKKWVWDKTGYAGRDDRQDIKEQPCAVREKGDSLSTGGLSPDCQGYIYGTYALSLQAVIQINDRNVHRPCPVAGVECAATPPPVITGNNTARMF